ncbi:MAG TPA: energy-coupled thiamine transporter ThiT [Firmicutes bacterium]|nr:energy-coupled thiamine transporter ThiT [Bacillota bacterium]
MFRNSALSISEYFTDMLEKFGEVDYKSWILFGAILILGIIIFIIARSNGKSKKLTTEGIVIGAVCIALSFILCNIRLFRMPNGGSVTPASSLPIFLYAYAFGPIPGLVCAFAYSILNIFSDPYILHPIQLLLDYLLPFTLMGLAGIFRFKKPYINMAAGIIFCVLLRYICHIASGIIFWDAWEYPPADFAYKLGYSAGYNSFIFVEMAFCLILIGIPQLRNLFQGYRNKRLNPKPAETAAEDN